MVQCAFQHVSRVVGLIPSCKSQLTTQTCLHETLPCFPTRWPTQTSAPTGMRPQPCQASGPELRVLHADQAPELDGLG